MDVSDIPLKALMSICADRYSFGDLPLVLPLLPRVWITAPPIRAFRFKGTPIPENIMPRLHGFYPKEFIPPSSKFFDSGRFGRMFGKLPPFAADTPQIRTALI